MASGTCTAPETSLNLNPKGSAAPKITVAATKGETPPTLCNKYPQIIGPSVYPTRYPVIRALIAVPRIEAGTASETNTRLAGQVILHKAILNEYDTNNKTQLPEKTQTRYMKGTMPRKTSIVRFIPNRSDNAPLGA